MFEDGHDPGEKFALEVDTYEYIMLGRVYIAEDRYDMRRVGKKQDFRVRSCFFTAFCCWNKKAVGPRLMFQCRITSYGLINSGVTGVVWMYAVFMLGFGTPILSIAEMVSM